MGTVVSYALDGRIATIGLDDGKVNVLSPALLAELDAALDQAEGERAVVVLTGREGVLSAGFDLGVLRAGGPDALGMVRAGFELALRLLSFPTPVIIACSGHAIAMGVFLLLSGDYRIGAAGPYRLMANEVAIGLPMPQAAVEIMRQRLTPAAFNRALLLAEPFTPDNAVEAGFLDRVVAPAELPTIARSTAETTLGLNLDAHAASKLRAREPALSAIRAGFDADHATT
jgi:enoyl-CoA hydratase